MDFRDIVLWLGLIAIVVILWDGFRRMKNVNKPKATKRAEESYIDPEEAARKAEIRRELPNGGARKREMTDEERRSISNRLNLRERVPMLMERVDVDPEEDEDDTKPSDIVQSELDFNAAMAEPLPEQPVAARAPRAVELTQPERGLIAPEIEQKQSDNEFEEDTVNDGTYHESVPLDENDLLDDSGHDVDDLEADDSEDHEAIVYVGNDDDDDEDDDDVVADIYSKGPDAKPEEVSIQQAKPVDTPVKTQATEPARQEQKEINVEQAKPVSQGPVEDIVVMHVMAPNEGELSGSAVLNLLLAAGLRHGPMEIFHYRNPNGYTEFSLANCVHPGIFNPDSMNQVNTPGVTLFMQLPTGAELMEAFDHMHQMAEYLASNLEAVILDEDHNKVTAQRLEYYRENLRAYARSKLIPS